MKKVLAIALLAMAMGCGRKESTVENGSAGNPGQAVSSVPVETATPFPETTPRPENMEPIKPLDISVSQIQVEDKVFSMGDDIGDVIAKIGEASYVSETENGKQYLYTDLEITEKNGKAVDVMLLSNRTRIAGEITFGTSMEEVAKLNNVQEIVGGYRYKGYDGIIAEFYTDDGTTVGGIHVYLP